MLDGVGISKVRMKENTITNRRQGVIPAMKHARVVILFCNSVVLRMFF